MQITGNNFVQLHLVACIIIFGTNIKIKIKKQKNKKPTGLAGEQ